ncbi:hypothetical protein [Novosphingobium sp. KA1]|uniref:hypothetical protein n=1 Tax=Novosphingobium sp. (strain KA1) TaxID=164608 RepID=UPI001A8E71F7|nr:hypothetical protein [Novosphingobium sp. KA1]QSR16441.1 hypothetical protein CA833_04455 [Novosphingobium sp. KA1]
MSKASRRSALLQPSSLFLLTLAAVSGLVIAWLAIERVQTATPAAEIAVPQDTSLRFAALPQSARSALLDIEVSAARTATRLDDKHEDRALATAQLATLAGSVDGLGEGVPAPMRETIAAGIARARDAAAQGETEEAARILNDLSTRMAAARSA